MPYRIDPEARAGMREAAQLKAEARRLRNERILHHLRQGLMMTEVAKLVGCNKNTVAAVRDQYLTAKRQST